MANIARFAPVDALRLDPWRNFEDMLRNWRLRPLMGESLDMPEFRIDVDEDEKAYYVKADIPGMRKEDIQVSIDDDLVTITAETKREKETKKGKSLYSERYCGKQERSFALRHAVDDGNAEASYKDGVLHLVLPKKAAPVPARRIAIK